MKMNDLAATTTASVGVAAKSVLEKPLHELTEDDISQLTREDCRRYLKEKGMRRPSWNKSQAIQQVICLKSLLEPPPPPPPHPPSNADSTLVVRPRHFPTPTVNSNSSSSMKELSPTDADADADASVSALGEDGGGPNQLAGTGTSLSEPTREGECRLDSRAVSIRGTNASHLPFDQMTIFYRGGVSVYDGVPVDKAQTIMHLAVNPIQRPQDEWNCGNLKPWSKPCQLPTPSVKVNVSTQDGAAAHFLSQDVEGQSNRRVLLQRYYEKKKDRGKYKMKRKLGSSPSRLEMYVNNQMRSPAINGQNTPNNASSKSHLGIPCSSFGLLDKEQKNHGLSVDLNDEA